MAPPLLLEAKASCSQNQRTSQLLGRWAGEWQKSLQKYVAELFISNLAAHRDDWATTSHRSVRAAFSKLSEAGKRCRQRSGTLTN